MVYLKIDPVILTIVLEKKMLTDDGRRRTDDAKCKTKYANLIVIGHLND